MNIPRALVVFVAVVLGACGGGGGGSTNGGGGGGDGGGDGGGGDGGGGSDNPSPNGTARIVFPLTASSATTTPTVTIRGIATDPEGIAGVSVNGVAATIKATASSRQNVLSKPGSDEGEVEWSAEVELAAGDNAVVISVEDESGEVTEDVDAATITYVEVPTTFTLDPDGTRLVGLSYTLTPSGYVQHLVEHNYDTLEQRVFTGISTAPEYTCFRRFEDEFIYLSFVTGTWELRRFDLTAEQDSLIVEVGDAEWHPGTGFRPTPQVFRLLCSGSNTSAYVLANYTDENGAGHSGSVFAKSRILEIDLATQAISILTETDTTAAPRWIVEEIALAEDSIVAMREFDPVAPLTSIPLAGGTPTELAAGVLVGGMALEPALNVGRVYVATIDSVDEIDVNTPGKQNISPVDDSDPLVFSQVRSIGFDPVNSRVIVGDSDLDTLIGIDIATGERSVFLARSVGTGTPLVAPRRFALSADATMAYVADDGSNGPERLLEIDLTTGDRQMIGNITQPFNYFVTGLALDEAGGRVFVSFRHLILEVSLETEEVQTVADTDSTELESVDDLVLDIENNRLLVGDVVNDAIFAVDLSTHAVTVVSQETSRGAGPSFGGVVSLTRVPGTSQLYVAGQVSETVTRVDLDTGDREALATTCDLGLSSTFQGLDQVLYGEGLNELIISGDKLYSLDLDSAGCTTLPRRMFPLRMQVTPTNEMLAVSFGTMTQIDRETGEVVIISK